MMKIGVVGAGPAGLYFALLTKKRHPQIQIEVVEQNPAEATYGWGVVFSDRALSHVAVSDPDVYRSIEGALETWDDQAIVHRGQRVRIDGSAFSGISRLKLLGILQDHCRRAGIEMHFEARFEDLTPFRSYDLIVGADGSNSVVRKCLQEHFDTSVEVLTNRYAWYGTDQVFDCLTLTFRETHDGVFVAHHYSYGKCASTFIVECDHDTWLRSGLGGMSEDEARAYSEKIFRDDLGGHPLRTNKSLWTNFRVIRNRNWSHQNVVLIGDALRTVHFSIGSGTAMALEDAAALAEALCTQSEPVAALKEFEVLRRPGVEKILARAEKSFVWYEALRERMRLEPIPFAYDYVTRGGSISRERLKERSPNFAAAYDAYAHGRGQVQTDA